MYLKYLYLTFTLHQLDLKYDFCSLVKMNSRGHTNYKQSTKIRDFYYN